MADRLYLSLWYPNFRLDSLPAALAGVLRQFAIVGGKRVAAASAYPINFTEPPTYQRIYVEPSPDPATSPPDINLAEASNTAIEAAVAEATEQLHDDMAYEFEMRWQLWSLDHPSNEFSRLNLRSPIEDDVHASDEEFDDPAHSGDTPWKLRAHTVRILGFGPAFDVAGYEQNGHLLVDFGLDSPWLLEPTTNEDHEDPEDDRQHEQRIEAQLRIQQNIEKLLAFTLLVEKNCGISSRLLWTESGEPLAEKLIARLQRVN